MNSKLVFTLLFGTILFFPGCYTILLTTNTDEGLINESSPSSQRSAEYVQVYDPYTTPEVVPQPELLRYVLPARVVSPNPATPTSNSDDHRQVRTERSSINSNPPPVRNDEKNTRDSGGQRGRR